MHQFAIPYGWRSHKIIWHVHGGSDTMGNRVMLHPHCHSMVHRRELEVVNPRLFTEALSEA
ncbi:MAG TPA: HNH endonuclease [Blastocatellia bacterium]|nr:HNH endonuclease [Blastocatellia bacterium]